MHFCILGCGKIAKTHAKILKKLESYVPGKPARISFASRDLQKAIQYKKKFKGDFTFGNYDEACAHKDIDVIIICTPNDQHKEWALKALEHKKDVIIEKPITCTVADADAILEKAKEVQKIVLVAENHRYRPHIRYLERLIQSQELGVLKMIRMNVMRKHQFKPHEWRAHAEKMGGGSLIDGGIHWINALLTFGGGEVRHVSALKPPTTLDPCPGEDSMALQVQFENGAVGILTYSWGIPGSFPFKFISVHGSRGSIYVSNTGMIGFKNIRIPHPLILPFRDWRGYLAMWQEFLIILANGNQEHCLCTGEIGRRDLALIEYAYASLPNRSASSSKEKKTKIA